MRILLVGADPNNSTDGFIVKGIRNLLSAAFPSHSEDHHFLYDHGPENYEPKGEYNAIVVCGTPWIWNQFHRSHKYKNLLNIFNKHPRAKRVFLGIGTCIDLDKMDTDICESEGEQEAMRLLYKDAFVTVREPLAVRKLEQAGVSHHLLPCPAFYSVDKPKGIFRPYGYKLFCWADPLKTISQTFWLENDEHYFSLMGMIVKEIQERAPMVYKAMEKEGDYPGHSEQGRKTQVFSSTKEVENILSYCSHLTSMRVHWAVPALAMGIPTDIIPLDSRYLTATTFDPSTLPEHRATYIRLLREFLGA